MAPPDGDGVGDLATDMGIDGGAASAEEAAVHITDQANKANEADDQERRV